MVICREFGLRFVCIRGWCPLRSRSETPDVGRNIQGTTTKLQGSFKIRKISGEFYLGWVETTKITDERHLRTREPQKYLLAAHSVRRLVRPRRSHLEKNRRRTAKASGIKRMPNTITNHQPAYAPKPAIKQAIGVMMPTNFLSAADRHGKGTGASGDTPSR